MANILVTGGNGYIGSHMCKLLCKNNHNVITVDNFSTSPKKWVHQFGKTINEDIHNKKEITQILIEEKIDAVIHFAAKASVEESQKNPMLYYQDNIVNTIQLLDACLKAKVQKFIFSSTCATFGEPKTDHIDEKTPQEPINSYGLSKKIIEDLLKDLCEKRLLNSVILRYFNVCGSDPDFELGENHYPETHLIPLICQSALNNQTQQFHLFGDDYPTSDGTCVRDYINVNDLTYAHMMAMEYLNTENGFHDFNIGSGKGSSIKEIINAFQQATSQDLNITISPRRIGDPAYLVADTTKAMRCLKFQAKTPIKESINQTFIWLKKKMN